MESKGNTYDASLQTLIGDVRSEIERMAGGVDGQFDARFVKLAKHWPDKIPPQVVGPPRRVGAANRDQDSGFTSQLIAGADVGFAWDVLWRAFTNWRKNVEANDSSTPTPIADAVSWIIGRAYLTQKQQNPRSGNGQGFTSKKKDRTVQVVLGGAATDLAEPHRPDFRAEKTSREIRDALRSATGNRKEDPETRVKRDPRLESVDPAMRGRAAGAAGRDDMGAELDARAPFLAIARWAASPLSRTRHVFRFNATQGVVFGQVGRLMAIGRDLPSALDAAADDHDQDVTRQWREGVRRAREILYVLGALGPWHALRSHLTLDAAVAVLDQGFKGRWTGDDITLLKAISRVAEATSDGFARLTPRGLSGLLEGNSPALGAAKEDATRSLTRLGSGDGSSAVDTVHRSESVVAALSMRPDPLCILGRSCPNHPSADWEDR